MINPDFSRAYILANEILVRSNVVSDFPIDIKGLVREETDIVLCKYSTALEKYNIDINLFGSESASLIEFCGRNIIFYNDNHVLARQLWSIAHELGHYLFGHTKNLDRDDPLYEKQELEANCFAAQLFMPEQLIREMVKRGKNLDESFLINAFGVSSIAACKRINTMQNFLQEWHRPKEQEFDDIILQKYYKTLERIAPRPKDFFDFEEELESQNYRDMW